jgi:hypothetical protein
MMNFKDAQCIITTAVNEKEKKLFLAMAHRLGVSSSVLMRRLVQYFLDGRILWTEMFGQRSELPLLDNFNSPKTERVRTTLTPEQYSAFVRRVEEWGSTTAIVVRRLILLYVTEKIERRNIWY